MPRPQVSAFSPTPAGSAAEPLACRRAASLQCPVPLLTIATLLSLPWTSIDCYIPPLDDNGSSTNILTARAWDDLVAFARQTGLQLLFDLNALGLRGANGAWDSTNAEQLLHYIKSHNQTDALYGFELGNEVRFRPSPFFSP